MHALRVPDGDPSAALEAVATQLQPLLASGATLVAVVPSWDAEPLTAYLRSVRSALDTTRLVVHRTSLTPLAAGALAELVAAFARRDLLSQHELVSVLPALERHVVGAAWLGSVTKLRDPAPTLAMHARSILPGTAFGVVLADDPHVVAIRAKQGDTLALPQPRVPGGWRVIVAVGDGGDVDLVRRSVARYAAGASTFEAPLTDVSTDWWGTDKLIDIALVPADLEQLARAVRAADALTPCAWCGAPITPPGCPYCGDHAHASASPRLEAPTGGGP